MDTIEQYFEGKQKLFEEFGYEPGYTSLEVEDYRGVYWNLSNVQVEYAKSLDILEKKSGDYYVSTVYRGRHIKQPVCRTAKYTMIALDTQCDGNKVLGIFDNSREGLLD